MKTIKMKCIKPHEYRQKMRKKGAKFDVDENHVEILRIAGLAEEVQPPQTKGRYQRRDMRASQ